VVEVAVGDGKPLPFMFDTGAGTTMTQGLAAAYGGKVIVEALTAAGGGILAWSPLREYPKLTVGGTLTITKATGGEPWNAPGALHCVSPNGLLGASAMSNAVWQINYETKKITTAAAVAQLDHIKGAIEVPFVRGTGLSPTPHLQLGVGNGKLDFLVDTGGGIPLSINKADLAKVGVEIPKDAPTADNLAFGAGGAFASLMTFIELPIKLGDTELVVSAAVGEGTAPGANGNIGHAFLESFVVTIDYTTDIMYLEPLFEGSRAPQLNPPSSAGVMWANGKLIVSAVAKGGPADEAGLTVGKVVTKVDGKSVGGITIEDYCATIFGARHETVTTEDGKTYDASPVEGFYTRKK
jgi:predicted aspartyl protease